MGQSSAKISDCVFPQPLWKPFGEQLGEEEGRERAEKDQTPKSLKKQCSGMAIGCNQFDRAEFLRRAT